MQHIKKLFKTDSVIKTLSEAFDKLRETSEKLNNITNGTNI